MVDIKKLTVGDILYWYNRSTKYIEQCEVISLNQDKIRIKHVYVLTDKGATLFPSYGVTKFAPRFISHEDYLYFKTFEEAIEYKKSIFQNLNLNMKKKMAKFPKSWEAD